MKKNYFLLLICFLFFKTLTTTAQIAGTFNVPGSFPSIAAAINTLNLTGVAGAVTINVAAGYTETVINGGLKLFNVPGSSGTNQVTFKKTGTGANPLLVAYTGGTAIPTSNIQDGVWWLIGASYITIDGIDIMDPNTANPSTMEFGYGLYKYSATQACQNNTIKNCTITLNRINGATGNTNMANGSRGIDLSCASYTSNPGILSSTTTTGAGSNNKFYSNYIQNCHTGIALMGDAYAISDNLNDVGGLLASTGNTIVNFGGGTGSETNGIVTNAQYSLNVSNNVLNNHNGSGTNPLTQLVAIKVGTATSANTTINSNTLSLNCVGSSTVYMWGIQNYSGNYGTITNTININNNVIAAYSYTGGVSVQFNLLLSFCNARQVNINNNLIQNVNVSPYSASFINAVNGHSCSISSNTITNVNHNQTQETLIATNSTYNNVIGNYINGINVSNQADIICLQVGGAGGSVMNNTLMNVSGTVLKAIDFGSGNGGVVKTITGNVIQNFSSPNNIYGVNFIGINAIHGTGASATVNISGNTIYSVTSVGTSSLINSGNLSGITCSLSVVTLFANKIYGFNSSSSGSIQGMQLNNCDAEITNNILGDFSIPNSSNSVAVVAISTNSNTTSKIRFNSIYLSNATGTGTNAGSSVLMLATGVSYTLQNNIFVNTSVPTGTGRSCIIRTLVSSFTPYGSSSNRNLFYTGAPLNNRLIYYDGTNSYSTMPVFKTAVTPREAQSVTENPPFITTVGSATNVLNINPVTPTQIEGGAAPISGILTDYIGTARNTLTPDIGAWEGTFTQADVAGPAISFSAFTAPACNLTNRTLTVNLNDPSGVATGSLAPRVYYRVNFGVYTSVQGILSSGTSTNGVWTFNLSYAASLSDVIQYFFVSQDASYLNNVQVIPSTNANVSDVNNVVVPPNPVYSYTIENNPTINVNSGVLCSGQNFTINPTGAFSYSVSGGSFVVSPTSSTSYSVTGASLGGCLSTNTVVSSVTVIPSPNISVNSGSLCAGNSFTMQPSGALSYTYQGGNPVFVPLASGIYTVAGSNTNSCISIAASNITVIALPQLSAANGTICIGKSYTLTPNGAVSYTFPAGGPVVSPISNTSYAILGSNLDGCVSLPLNVLVTVQSDFPNISVSSGSICEGFTFLFNATGAYSYTYSSIWNFVTPLVTTVYTITGSNFNSACSSSVTSTVVVEPKPPVFLNINPLTICVGESATLSCGGALSYTWNFGPNGNFFIIYPFVTTPYSVIGTSSAGCTNSAAQTLSVDVCNGLNNANHIFATKIHLVPNPNTGSFLVECPIHAELLVFNSNGQLLFKSKTTTTYTPIDLSNESNGIYFLRIVYNEFSSTQKIIKE